MAMHFTLVYDGKLKASRDKKHKQEIRRALHRQLVELWKGTPFESLRNPGDELCKEIGKWRFFPLASSARNELVELSIVMLRPGMDAGHVVTQGGDIDNRLKTLFDSLRMPQDVAELPQQDRPEEGENPFFCLLEDDKLITSVSITTDRLLEPCESRSHAKLVIQVQIRKIPNIGGNMIGRAG